MNDKNAYDRKKKHRNLVYMISVAIIVIITVIAGSFPTVFGTHAQQVYDYIANHFGWLFLVIIFILDSFFPVV